MWKGKRVAERKCVSGKSSESRKETVLNIKGKLAYYKDEITCDICHYFFQNS